MTCITTAPVSRRRAAAPSSRRAAAASSSSVASRPVLFTKDDNSVSVACTYDYMGRRATKVVTENGVITTSHRFLYRGYLQRVRRVFRKKGFSRVAMTQKTEMALIFILFLKKHTT